MKKKQWLSLWTTLCLTLCLSLISSSGAAAATTNATLRDLAGHWSYQQVTAAAQDGWVSGYEDGTFRPEKTVTRAEFIKMLAAAAHLTADRPTVQMMMSKMEGEPSTTLTDVRNHWLAKNGFYEPAYAAGLIVAADYAGNQFQPDRAITRQEIAVMVDRVLGLVYPALNEKQGTLPFKDYNTLPEWLKGYVEQAYKAGVLSGYPDGTIGTNRTATRAEAVSLIQRAVDKMREGSDPNIKVQVQADVYENGQRKLLTNAVPLSVPAQRIDGRIYVPARNLFETASQMRKSWFVARWYPVSQTIYLPYGNEYTFVPGTEYYGDRYGMERHPYNVNVFKAKVRMLDGEVMIPLYDPSGYVPPNLGRVPTWDEATKTLTFEPNYVPFVPS